MDRMSVFLVDDHQIVLDGLSNIIQSFDQFEVIGTARNGLDALQHIRSVKPDLALVDIDMPIMNGITLVESMNKLDLKTKIIILSLHHENSIIKHLIRIGVNGFLLKNSDKQELLRAMETVRKGQKYFSADVTMALTNMIDKPAQVAASNEDVLLISSLTEREKEIIQLICTGLTNKELANQLFISPRTADAHRSNVMKKLNVKNVVGLVKFAMRNGMI